MIHIPRMRGEVEKMVTAIAFEVGLSRGNDARCQWVMITESVDRSHSAKKQIGP